MKKLSQLFSVIALIVVGALFLLDGGEILAEDAGWKVWVKVSPCSGRFDWVSAAKENPTSPGGGSFWYSADYVLSGGDLKCTHNWSDCTFAEASAEREIVRASGRFSDFCCRDYSVWENAETGKLSIVQGKFGTAGFGWRIVRGDLCCEEAEALAGLPGACNGTHGGGKTGYIGCYKDLNNPFDLDGFLERSQSNTPQRCMEICRAKGFAYAGVQYGESCLCGNSYGKYGQADNCNYPCTGDSAQICGGINSNSVYSTSGGGATVFKREPLSARISGGGIKIGLRDSISLSSQVSGGAPPYTYLWTAPGWGSWTRDSILYNFATINAQPGRLTINLQVTDSQNNTTNAQTFVDIVGEPLSVRISGGGIRIGLKDSATLYSQVSGGVPPYAYLWTAPGWGSWTGDSILYNFATIIAQPGRTVVNLQITDSRNNTAYAETFIDLENRGDSGTVGNGGERPCNANEAAAFTRMAGSWKSSGPKVTIGGSCERATGTYFVAEYCENPDATYNQGLPRYRGDFTGRMEGDYLQVKWFLPGGTVHPDQNGTASCSLSNDGTLGCSGFGCGIGGAKRE